MHDFMCFFSSSKKSFSRVFNDLKAEISKHGYTILDTHDLSRVFRSNDIDFKENYQVFDVCNPTQAARLLEADMQLAMALPFRMSIFTENNEVKFGMIHPVKIVSELTDNEIALEVAAQVDATLRQIIKDTK